LRTRTARSSRIGALAIAAALAFSGLSCSPEAPAPAVHPTARGAGESAGSPVSAPPATPELLALGRQTYERQCAACHGADGRGNGEAAYLLYPKPRDFTAARFSIVSTWEGNPSDRDLFRTITRGMPGSAMPSWGHLPERTRWALVHTVKSFAEEPWEVGPVADRASEEVASGIIQVPPEPPYDTAAIERARELYEEGCASCHGPTGRGDGAREQIDEKGYPTRPRDLTLGIFKGDPSTESVYRRIVAGMPGTPMPMSDWAHGEDAWHLVHLIRSLSSDEQRARAEMRKFEISAPRVSSLPDHPDSSLWNAAEPVNLHLMPLWWRADRPEELTVRALHDGSDLAVLLSWADATHDHTAMRVQDFRDAVAMQLSPTADPPFFGMGERGRFVNIWMWKSERQADLEPAFQDLEKVYPNIGIDSYPNLLRSALEQPARRALTLESDPTFVTGWGAGNLVSDPTRGSASEDLRAQGFGTLQARPGTGSGVHGEGIYSTGSYRVIFRRSLSGAGPDAVGFETGGSTPVAFAVWDGSAGDRDGKKSVTIWQELKLEP
jgi:mono/diheme cytochrome c family protein